MSTERRASLDARWTLCATLPGTIETAEQLEAASGLEWFPIRAPDTVAGALREIGRWSLDEPHTRFDASDWWFRASFEAPPHPDTGHRVLAFNGLAGECTIWLNGAVLLSSDNMHIARHCAVELKPGENELLMRFASLDARLAQRRPRPRWYAPMIEHQQLRWARVSLLGRTPGWSPPAPVIGPWRAIEWIDRQDVEISALRLKSELVGETGLVTLNVTFASSSAWGTVDKVMLRVSRNGASHEALAAPEDGGGTTHAAALSLPRVTPWWPHTHGEPALYDAELVIDVSGASEPVRVDLGRLGFRKLALGTVGGDFALRLNGVPVFCRGANWTPLDIASPAASAAATRAALEQVQAAGLNMLRINGCMVYEDSAFFDACDELGLLVWQDFMFANMDYPAADEDFAASVLEEASQQLAGWQAHPSLAVICGNSEAEQQAAMWGSPRENWSQPLFDEQLATLARSFCPEATYWSSSAHGGAFPHQNDVGTTSYYGVGAYLRPLEDARHSGLRFASESLAFSNIPSPATLARMPGGTSLRVHHPGWKARAPRDLGAGWDFEDVRDHYLQRLYRIDPTALRSTDHERYLQLSRTVSTEVIEATISEWRRPASRCRGALVWFLRDLWAGAGWGLLDEQGAPKAAFYGMRRASAAVHLFMTDEGTNGLALHLVNDPGVPLAGSIEIALYRDDGLRMEMETRELEVPAHGGRSWAVAEWFDAFIDLSRAYRFGPAEYALVAATLRNARGDILDRAFHYPEGLSATRRRDVGLKIEGIEKHEEGGILVALSAKSPAQSVYFDADGYLPEDDYFHLAPGEIRNVRLMPAREGAQLAARIGVSALNAWSGATCEVMP